MHQPSLKVDRKTGRDVAVSLNLFVGPFACQSKLSPFADIRLRPARILRRVELLSLKLPAAGALGTEDAIQLVHRDLSNGIILVDDDDCRPQRATFFVATGRD